MTPDPLNLPASRTWRDIPQPVKPRAMSNGGRLRLALAAARVVGGVGVAAGLAWGGWQVTSALRTNPRAMPTAAKGAPLKRLDLQTATGGVLDGAWLSRTLALPKGATLMELELERLRARLLADGQVLTATLLRKFPDTLVVQVTERVPVARVRVETSAGGQTYLVARDGAVYLGTNYDDGMLRTLPWLDGIVLKPEGAGFRPVASMDVVADLLARAQYEATHLYVTWRVVSLARLEADREIEVLTRDGSHIVFSARSDFFPQLAKLDNILVHLQDTERFPRTRASRVRIDLSLGREVPVMLEPVLSANEPFAPAPRPALAPGFNAFPSSSLPQPREL